MSKTTKVEDITDIETIEKIPFEQRLEATNTYAMIERYAIANPRQTAISFLFNGADYETPIQISYGALIKNIRKTANLFYKLGVRSNDVVSFLLPNLPQTHYVIWGAEAVGIVNPINPLLEPDTIKDICCAAQTKILVCPPDLPGTDVWRKVDAIRKQIPSLEYVIQVMGQTDENENILGYETAIEKCIADKLDFSRDIAPDDVASLYHTGGTTGTPKLAMRTHMNECITSWMVKEVSGLIEGDTVLCGLPLFHCNGVIMTGLVPFSFGGEVLLTSLIGFRDTDVIQNFYKIVEQYRVTAFSAVPTILSALLEVPVGNADLSSFKHLACGAAPLSVEIFKRFEAHTGMKILEGYGLTEGTVSTSINPKDGQRKIGSVGIRLPYQEIKIAEVNEEGAYIRDMPQGEIGVVCIKGPNVFKGYVEERYNQNIWVGDGWFNTGDLGRFDADGYLWLTGRKKELIIRGGHNIDPAIIEETFYKIPGVQLAAAVGRPDVHAGEVPIAYVQVSDTSRLDAAELLALAKKNIGERAAVPKEVIIIPELPLTSIGKTYKPALKRDALKRVLKSELEAFEEVVTAHVNVKEDMRFGSAAFITVVLKDSTNEQAVLENISERLGNYTIHFEIEVLQKNH